MCVAALAIAALALWCQHLILPFSTPFWGLFDYQLDLDVYRAGALTVWDGGSLYDAKLLGQMDYTYAPVSVIVLMPFAWMSFEAARIVWSVGIIVALYLVIVLCFRALGRDVNWPLRCLAVALVAVSMLLEPVRTTIWYGQINVFLLLIILADLVRPDGSRLKGVGAGIAAGIKLTPLIFVLYFALLRRWRAMAGVVGGFLLTAVVGFVVLPKESWSYWTDKIFDSNRVGAPQTLGNQSLRGLIANLMHTDAPNTAVWMVLVLIALGLGMGSAVLAHRRGHELLAISIVGMTSCAVSPMAWGHHWVWFVPIVVICVNLLLRTDLSAMRRVSAGIGLVALILTAFAWRTHFAYPMWFVNRTVPDAYFTGLFFKAQTGPAWAQAFLVYPYNAIFLGTTIGTLVVLGLLDRPARPTEENTDPTDTATLPS
ncbi:glycosyltransferase 87 family protein [Gordonia sp. L191]|uniref:glycosyltransferase 87 family protein n=1 Tax=Gordonia sp. L191 TaxID=2982699 RepID=UPI0024C08F0F|nr:glycosyltransferase 87 family protein [Gordonia sp. L191]WHU50137.1 glycosyltransferase 87 family protein [Gordonia sp. L191]